MSMHHFDRSTSCRFSRVGCLYWDCLCTVLTSFPWRVFLFSLAGMRTALILRFVSIGVETTNLLSKCCGDDVYKAYCLCFSTIVEVDKTKSTLVGRRHIHSVHFFLLSPFLSVSTQPRIFDIKEKIQHLTFLKLASFLYFRGSKVLNQMLPCPCWSGIVLKNPCASTNIPMFCM